MVINIPVEIDEGEIEGKLTEDCKRQVTQLIYDQMEEYFKSKDDYHHGFYECKNAQKGFECLIDEKISCKIDELMKNEKDHIIDIVATNLINRVSRTKAFKELKEE